MPQREEGAAAVRLQEKLGWARVLGIAGQVSGVVQGPQFQLGFPVFPGVRGELPFTALLGAWAGCSPAEKMLCRDRTLMWELRAWS